MALQNFGEYHLPLDQHPFPHVSIADLQSSFQRMAVTLQGGSTTGRLQPGWQNPPKSHPRAQPALPRVKPNWLAALGRVVGSQGEKKTHLYNTLFRESYSILEFYRVTHSAQAGCRNAAPISSSVPVLQRQNSKQ